MDVSVIVVNYKTRDLTLQCLRSLFKYTYGVKMEVIVVDNASQDDTPYSIRREFPQVRVVESQENLGFGKANNLGNTYAIGKYLFLLNSDTIVIHNIVRQFFEFMEIHPEYVSCGGNLLDRDGVNCNVGGNFPSVMQEFLSIGFHRLVPRWFKNRYTLSKSVADSGMDDICYVIGADMFIRKEIFDRFQGFDPAIFMYYEETDLYYRMHLEGLRSCILPYAPLIHLEGGSFGSHSRFFNLRKIEMLLCSKCYFFRKHYSRKAVMTMKCYVAIGAIIRPHRYKCNLFGFLKKIIKE
ncbi:glycosyltransferase family 2 protein [uncultured Bacteroides sp.]|uniref:glycosyltransferase family 2 protein n=1 Tax=uncultured Bacteroides sp. TaxID=162156 RepID=UPI0025D1D432|nr:glycosyltransferase family 2 protein [uncultured Bacteroides sp.]